MLLVKESFDELIVNKPPTDLLYAREGTYYFALLELILKKKNLLCNSAWKDALLKVTHIGKSP